MRVAVLGGGVIGITTAWELLNAGAEVTVFEAGPEVAGEASAANASLITPGHAVVWNSPQAPLRYASTLFKTKSPVGFSPSVFVRSIPWVTSFLRNSTPRRAPAATTALTRLAISSAHRLRELLDDADYDIDASHRGVLYWHNTNKSLANEKHHADFLVSEGIDATILDRDELLELEPAFGRSKTPPVGALYVRDDSVGDGRRFTEHLAQAITASPRGQIVLNAKISKVAVSNERLSVATPNDIEEFDNVVVCLGAITGSFLKQHNVRLPIAPAKGYSITATVTDRSIMPKIGGVDFSEFCAITPLGDRLRVTAIARFEGHDTTFKPANFATHRRVVDNVFPGLVDWESPLNEWAGLRPMSSDGKPTIDAVPGTPGLWVNAGHGYLGWTLSMASADIIAKKMLGRTAPTGSEPFAYRW
ncbi:MAG: FAD-dependent oxidoreductase [Acidobacteria bacterium]|nr:FAD-dependent oxidoreductase [Acidobacteriota bacterium]